MCRQYFTLYAWCQCEEAAGENLCSARKRTDCPGMSIETVHMQCFCNQHATKSFKTDNKSKKSKRNSESSSENENENENEETSPLAKKWNLFRGLRSGTF